MLATSNLRLHKIASNHPAVIEAFPPEWLNDSISSVNIVEIKTFVVEFFLKCLAGSFVSQWDHKLDLDSLTNLIADKLKSTWMGCLIFFHVKFVRPIMF